MMVSLRLVDGKKGDGDILVLVTADDEPLKFGEWLFLGQCYFASEDSYYPISEGYLGRGHLLSAINCIGAGVPLETVFKRFKLPMESRKLNIIDERKTASRFEKPVTKLHELLLRPMEVFKDGKI
jgi:hypothetical protein